MNRALVSSAAQWLFNSCHCLPAQIQLSARVSEASSTSSVKVFLPEEINVPQLRVRSTAHSSTGLNVYVRGGCKPETTRRCCNEIFSSVGNILGFHSCLGFHECVCICWGESVWATWWLPGDSGCLDMFPHDSPRICLFSPNMDFWRMNEGRIFSLPENLTIQLWLNWSRSFSAKIKKILQYYKKNHHWSASWYQDVYSYVRHVFICSRASSRISVTIRFWLWQSEMF